MNEEHEPLRGKWSRYRNRPPEDRTIILRAALILLLTEIGLYLFGFRRWMELLGKLSLKAGPPQALPAELQRETALRAARAVRSAELHGPTHPNCLERSLTLWWILRHDGVDGELHIGARREGGKFEAHAWVELAGHVLNDGAEIHRHYSRFDAPIAAAVAESHRDGKAVS